MQDQKYKVGQRVIVTRKIYFNFKDQNKVGIVRKVVNNSYIVHWGDHHIVCREHELLSVNDEKGLEDAIKKHPKKPDYERRAVLA